LITALTENNVIVFLKENTMTAAAEQSPYEKQRRVRQELLSPMEQLFIQLYRAIEAAGGELEEAEVLKAVGMQYPDQNLQAAEALGIENHIIELGKSWQSFYRLIPGHERDLERLTYYHPRMVKELSRPPADSSQSLSYSPR
jgi:hypothetical protein